MHQVRFVERVAVELLLDGFAYQDLGSLRDTSQQFVRRMRRKNHRLVRGRPIRPDRMHVLIEFMECRMRKPGFIEVQGTNTPVQNLAQGFNVVDDPIVGALRDRQNPRLAVWVFGLSLPRKNIRINLLLNRFRQELFHRNRSDDSEIVSCRS